MKLEDFTHLFESVYITQRSEEMYWLVNEVEKIKPHTIIEVGVQYGGTLKFWEQLVEPSDLVIGIDERANTAELIEQKSHWNWKETDRNIILVIGNSTEPETIDKVRKALEARQADLLYINGDHAFKTVLLDFANYSQFVRDGGLVGFHDLNLDGPRKLFDSLLGRKLECDAGWGTGLWWKQH